MYKLIVEGRPVPKKRPRVTQKATYTPQDTKRHEKLILAKWQQEFGRKELEGDLHVQCTFYYSDNRTADIDNLCKAVLDGIGGGGEGWSPFNDRQVRRLGASIEVEDEERTEIRVSEL